MPIDPRYWQIDDALDREHFRRRNLTGRATLTLVDDTGREQVLQFEGYPGEIRDGMQRVGQFGFHSVPLAGASAVTLHHGGDRGFNTAVGIEDRRYRPKGGQPGESGLYAVDGADAKGAGGTMWWAFRALKGRIGVLLGKTITIGDKDTVNITVTGSGLLKFVGNVEITGTLKVDGATTVQDLAIQGNESGGGSA